MANSDLISMVYLSTAVFPFSSQDLIDLLAKSRENNTALGVSGMLLFKENNFLQVLEGERGQVLKLFNKIKKDPRHRRVTTLSQEDIVQRDFPDWSMGFNNLSSIDASRPYGFTPFLETSLTVADFAADPSRAKKLLLLFKEEKLLAKGAGPR
ncbi:MAG: BLUF domain-containing protein [Candidatus Sulfotelmatobacter sp.]|jgi:hypothetical protein